MNRKAKFAYFYMVIGLILFLFGFLIILNYNLNKDWKSIEESSKLIKNKLNFTELLIIATRSKSINSIDNQNDINIYLLWFCQLKYDYKSINDDSQNDLSNLVNEPTSLYENKKIETSFRSKLIKSELLKNLFSFLICSSEKVYISIIVGLSIFGCLLLCYGCIRFYKYDIKLIQDLNSYSLNSNAKNKTNINQDMVNIKTNSNTKCFECCCFNIPKNSNSNSNNENKNKKEERNSIENYNDKTSVNSFDYIDAKTDKKLIPKIAAEKANAKALAAERMCPFIYEELPAFMVENKTYIFSNQNQRTPSRQSNNSILNKSYELSPKIPNTKPPQFLNLPASNINETINSLDPISFNRFNSFNSNNSNRCFSPNSEFSFDNINESQLFNNSLQFPDTNDKANSSFNPSYHRYNGALNSSVQFVALKTNSPHLKYPKNNYIVKASKLDNKNYTPTKYANEYFL